MLSNWFKEIKVLQLLNPVVPKLSLPTDQDRKQAISPNHGNQQKLWKKVTIPHQVSTTMLYQNNHKEKDFRT